MVKYIINPCSPIEMKQQWIWEVINQNMIVEMYSNQTEWLTAVKLSLYLT